MSSPIQHARNVILDLARCNSTHRKDCPRYHIHAQPLPDCNCVFRFRLEEACMELEQIDQMVSAMKKVLE